MFAPACRRLLRFAGRVFLCFGGRSLRHAVTVLACVVAAPVAALDAIETLDRARTLEAEGMSDLASFFKFEDGLLAEDNDRVVVFLSMPHGARLIMDEVAVTIDGEVVLRHPYSVGELMLLQGRASQLLHVTRLPRGEHTIKVDLKVMQGRVMPMQPFAFTKERTSRYLEILITGSPVRQIEVVEW